METDHHDEQFLPHDVVLEIAARISCPATVVRCAALSKPIRRAVLRRQFLRRLVRRRAIAGAAANNRRRFVPSLLLGVYHRPIRHASADRPLEFSPASASAARVAASLALPVDGEAGDGVFGPYTALSSRRSLVVLRRRRHGGGEITVCNAATGERWVIPPPHAGVAEEQSLVLLDVAHRHGRAGTRSSFSLLAAQLPLTTPTTLTFQVFSSSSGEWGPPVGCAVSRRCELHCPPGTNPVVLRGGGGAAVHWLCATGSGNRVLKLSLRQPKASLMRLPPPCESGVDDVIDTCLALSPATDGRRRSLSVIALRRDGITVWVRAGDGEGRRGGWGWERRHVIREDGVARPVDLGEGWMGRMRRLEWFGEGSGAVLMEGNGGGGGGALVLDMGGMAVKKLGEMIDGRRQHFELYCPYEVDLISYMMFVMNPF
uniref:DUF7595 domain-containing protein n=1 Tax=Leersia perrieri TaxID=77586 RepID=A0A0D9VWE0_9ORYZ